MNGWNTINAKDIGVVGLELEGLWDEVSVDNAMESSILGLYVAGDATGLAQGILQICSGQTWYDNGVNKKKDSAPD